MEQALAFYDNMVSLQAQGVPVFWEKVAQQMATAVRAQLAQQAQEEQE